MWWNIHRFFKSWYTYFLRLRNRRSMMQRRHFILIILQGLNALFIFSYCRKLLSFRFILWVLMNFYILIRFLAINFSNFTIRRVRIILVILLGLLFMYILWKSDILIVINSHRLLLFRWFKWNRGQLFFYVRVGNNEVTFITKWKGLGVGFGAF
jgi:hypothetical protein